jgi:hypothetical protein
MHWKELTLSVRERLLSEFSGRLPEYSLKAVVFPLVLRGNKRELYLRACPQEMGLRLSRLVSERCNLLVVVPDTDFDSLAPEKGAWARRPTLVFLDCLVSRLGSELAGSPFSARPSGGGVVLDAAFGGRSVRVEGRVGSSSDEEVRVADVVLGLFLLGKERRVLVRNVDEQATLSG